ncbi:DNA/RNA nuclease SfsA [Rhodobacteraceae bacterium 2CG4]|uniref:Sugar fermentation stimulation protein homolog n=1 Tax=Halovulum marinum TaxID=2662447 RepID=A0A6L5YZX4_9RHOB|nr:DNA/RNA nuclease SfsA [Halovulum marinum]MSU89405.1 DNA/RNA nuclease SfsA [Halovulum marinum]
MQFDRPLIRATLLRRYKRFLADVTLEDGRQVTAHCANPGAMTGLAQPGAAVWLRPAANPKRKLQWSWTLVELPGGHFASVDTGLANRLVAEALAADAVPALAGYASVRPEVRYGAGSRVDFLLRGPDRADAYVEVKSVTLRRAGRLAEFPDTVTARGARHLAALTEMAAQGHRAVLLYLAQRDDCDAVALAADIDPAYAAAARAAHAAGVEALAHGTRITPDGLRLDRALPVRPPG